MHQLILKDLHDYTKGFAFTEGSLVSSDYLLKNNANLHAFFTYHYSPKYGITKGLFPETISWLLKASSKERFQLLEAKEGSWYVKDHLPPEYSTNYFLDLDTPEDRIYAAGH